jgi:transcriptional regulator with XRE-family HTH domain
MQQIDGFTDKVISELEKTRQEVGMTTQELIRKSGIRRSTYFRKMRGETEFTTSDIDAIAKALGADPFLILHKASSAVEQTPITVDPSVLTEDEIMERVNAKIDAGAVGLAALHDPDKGKSKGVDPEFA